MSEHLPYEDELLKQLQDLPLPGEDMAWEDMRRRLKDDDDNPAVPPLAKGCGRYVLLLLVLLAAVLLITDPFKWFHQKKTDETVQILPGKNANGQDTGGLSANKTIKNETMEIKDTFLPGKKSQNEKKQIGDTISPGITNKQNPASTPTILMDSSRAATDNAPNNTVKRPGASQRSITKLMTGQGFKHQIKPGILTEKKQKNYAIKKNGKALVDIDNPTASNVFQKTLKRNTKGKLLTTISGEPSDSINPDPTPTPPVTEHHSTNINKDTSQIVIPVKKPAADSLKRKMPDTIAVNNKEKPDSSDKRRIYFSAGLALHQLLPVAGQEASPYSSTGRKGSLADYIPSIYLRMYREKRWFIQSEFRYGAPQYNRELVFNDKVRESGSQTVSAFRSTVKKTFYNQLPVSFNYFILPGLSLGAGLTLNKFKAALIQRDFHITNLTTLQDTLVSSQLISQKGADSNFVTTYFQGMIDMQYQWRRLSLGARYSLGIQPYLKFKLPGGQESKERNTALQLFIRYELWRSKK